MLGIDLNTSAGTALLALVLGILFVWGAVYATTLAAALVWAFITLLAFLLVYMLGQRVFQYLKHGRKRRRPR